MNNEDQQGEIENEQQSAEGELLPAEVKHAGGRDQDYGPEPGTLVPFPAQTQELTQREEQVPAAITEQKPEEAEWDRVLRFAQFAAASGLYPDQTDMELAQKALVGTALGLSIATSFQALQKIRQGINIPAEVQRALARRAGYRIRQVELTYEVCTLQLIVDATGQLVGETTYTLEDASKAKLLGNEVWSKYRKSMLFARATTDLISRFAPECLFFAYDGLI